MEWNLLMVIGRYKYIDLLICSYLSWLTELENNDSETSMYALTPIITVKIYRLLTSKILIHGQNREFYVITMKHDCKKNKLIKNGKAETEIGFLVMHIWDLSSAKTSIYQKRIQQSWKERIRILPFVSRHCCFSYHKSWCFVHNNTPDYCT